MRSKLMAWFAVVMVVAVLLAMPACQAADVKQSEEAIATAVEQATLARDNARQIIDDPTQTDDAKAIASTALKVAETVLENAQKAQAGLAAAKAGDGSIDMEGVVQGLAVAVPPLAPYIVLGGPLVIAIVKAVRKSRALAGAVAKIEEIKEDAKSIVWAVDALRAQSSEVRAAMKTHKAIIDSTLTEGAYDLVQAASTTTKS